MKSARVIEEGSMGGINQISDARLAVGGKLRLSPNVSLETIAVILLLIPPFFRVFLPQLNATTTALTLVALLLLLASATHSSGKTGRCNRVPIPILLLGVMFFYFVVNANLDIAHGQNLLWFIQFGGVLCAVCLLLFCRADRWVDAAFQAIAVFGMIYAASTILFWIVPASYSLVQPYLQSKTSAVLGDAGYMSGLTTHYSTNAIYITFGFLACSFIAISTKRQSWTACACICLFALVLTTKRAQLAFGVASFAIAYFVLNSNRKLNTFGRILFAAAAALLILYIASFFSQEVLMVFERFQSMEDDDSFGGRSWFYTLCLSMWGDSPVTGNGWGSFPLEFSKTPDSARYFSNGYTLMYAHNVYLQLLAEEGLIGLALFVGAEMATVILAIKGIQKLSKQKSELLDNEATTRVLLAGYLSVQLFFAMYCLTGNPLYDAYTYVPWLISIGASLVMLRRIDRRRGQRSIQTGHHSWQKSND